MSSAVANIEKSCKSALMMAFNRRSSKAMLALVLSVGSHSMTHATDSGDALSLLGLPIGKLKTATLPLAEHLWGSAASCTSTKTGMGQNRRAYFLETCTFDNTRRNSLYNETPSVAQYYYLDDRLVQIAYDFEKLNDLEKLRGRARQDLLKLQENNQLIQENNTQNISVADDGRTVVFHAQLVPQIHILSGTPK